MPIFAVLPAAVAIGGAIGAVATGASILTTALAVTAAVGATVGAIGQVTHNKGLMTAGLVVGAIGGIGGLASAAGVFGDTGFLTSTASSAANAGQATASAAGDVTPLTGAAEGGLSFASGSSLTSGELAPFINPASEGTLNFLTGSSLTQTTPQTPQGIYNFSTTSDPTGAGESLTQSGEGGMLTPTDTTAQTAAQPAATQTAANTNAGVTPSSAAQPAPAGAPPAVTGQPQSSIGLSKVPVGDIGSPDQSWFGKLMDYAGAHPVVAYGALQAGGALLSGLTSSLTPAQVAALNAQAAAQSAQAAFTAQQTANLAMPKSVARSTPVTGQPMMPTGGTPQGFINATPQMPQVTGVPA